MLIHPSYALKHALSVGCAIFIAVVVQFYFSFTNEYWIVLSAFLISQTTRGTPLRQNFLYLSVILVAFLLGYFLVIYINQIIINGVILTLTFIALGCLFAIYEPMAETNFYLLLYFLLVLMLTVFDHTLTAQSLRYCLFDIGIGAFISIVVTQFLFPIKLQREFRHGLVSILQGMIDLSQAMLESLKQHTTEHENKVNKQKINLEKILQNQTGCYPEWVFEVGFNPGLRSSWRYFLIHLEQIIETFFAMNFAIHYLIDSLPEQINRRIDLSMQRNQELLEVLLTYFSSNELKLSDADFTEDIVQLEQEVRAKIPDHSELLALSADMTALVSLARDCKDIRQILLKLIMSLQNK